NGRFAKGVSGNPGGSPEATRRAFNKRFLLDLAEDWQQHGREVFKRVRRESPAAYLKVCAMLVPKEVKLEHSTSAIKAMTDEQIEQAIEAIQNMLAAQADEATKVIEGTAGPAALPAPEAQSIGAGLEPKRQRRPNRHRGRPAGAHAEEAQGAIATCRVTSACGRCGDRGRAAVQDRPRANVLRWRHPVTLGRA